MTNNNNNYDNKVSCKYGYNDEISNNNGDELNIYIPRILKELSIYIPRISKEYNDTKIKTIFYDNYVGYVTRVDFITKKNDSGKEMRSAFVYFNDFYSNEIYETVFEKNECHRFVLKNKKYWILLKNNKPVANTELNIHQLAENMRIMGEKVLELEKENEVKSKEIDNLKQTVYQMIYDVCKNDKERRRLMIDVLFKGDCDYEKIPDLIEEYTIDDNIIKGIENVLSEDIIEEGEIVINKNIMREDMINLDILKVGENMWEDNDNKNNLNKNIWCEDLCECDEMREMYLKRILESKLK
jgi:hypothetical protein